MNSRNKNPGGNFPKGKSGNPKGRPPKGESLTEILRELGEVKDINYHGDKIARKRALAEKMWNMALSGDRMIMTYLVDRLEGKANQPISGEIGTYKVVPRKPIIEEKK